jgi:hypothetical protein
MKRSTLVKVNPKITRFPYQLLMITDEEKGKVKQSRLVVIRNGI